MVTFARYWHRQKAVSLIWVTLSEGLLVLGEQNPILGRKYGVIISNRDAFERRAVEQAVLKMLDPGRNFDALEGGASREGTVEGRDGCREGDLTQRMAIPERVVKHGDALRDVDSFERITAIKRRTPDALDGGRQRDLLETVAVAESVFPDLRHAVRNLHVLQSGTHDKATVRYGSQM